MTKMTIRFLALLLATGAADSAGAHHSLANFDTTQAVRVKGTVVEFHQINPHSLIFMDEKTADGKTRRWAIEGPAVRQLVRSGFAKDALKAGDVVEVCGYLPKDVTIRQIANPDARAQSISGRLLNAETMVMPDGREQSWGDYHFHKCFPPGYNDGHATR